MRESHESLAERKRWEDENRSLKQELEERAREVANLQGKLQAQSEGTGRVSELEAKLKQEHLVREKLQEKIRENYSRLADVELQLKRTEERVRTAEDLRATQAAAAERERGDLKARLDSLQSKLSETESALERVEQEKRELEARPPQVVERVVTKEVEVEVVRFVEKDPDPAEKTERNSKNSKGGKGNFHDEPEEREEEPGSGIEPRTEKRLELLGVGGVERDEIEESSETVNKGKESRRYESREEEGGDSYAED